MEPNKSHNPERPSSQKNSKPLPKTDADVRSIRTYQDDMAQAVENQSESAISLSVKQAEKKQKQGNREVAEKADRSVAKTALTFMSIFFIIGGMLIIGYFWWQSRPVVEERAIIDTLLLADKEITESIEGKDKSDIVSFIASARQNQGSQGEVTYINFETNAVTGTRSADAPEILRAVGSRAPATLTRSMDGDSMFGLITLMEETVPFWVIEVDSFENAFGGILDWETLLQEDLGEIFSNKDLAFTPVFKDVIAKNRDIRVLYNDRGEEILVHSFLDKNTLIFTSNQKAFEKLLPLFISSKQVR